MSLIDSIIGAESGGDPNAKNPRSSATGAAQFIDSTWLSMLSKHRPDLTGSREELLALRTDPILSRQMAEAYASDNGAILSNAGLPVTPGSTYLAHFAGPQGAVRVLSADPSTPVASILDPGAVRANPFLQGMTTGQLQAWADRKVGGASPRSASAVAQAAPPAQAASVSAPPGAAPSFPAASEQQQSSEPFFAQMPVEQMQLPPPIFAPPRKPISLSQLRLAQTRPSGGFFFGRG